MNPKMEALTRIVVLVEEAVQTAGPMGIPDGQLYMLLQSTIGQSWTLGIHQQVIGALVDAGKITNTNHLLKAKKGK